MADRYTVLRDGRSVGSGRMEGTRLEDIIQLMVGRELTQLIPRVEHTLGETVLSLDGLKGARMAALQAFAEKRTPVLVATNVASRGLDLPEISHVINFDVPEDVDTYIHRVGRTARMGRSGTAITFVGQHDLQMFDELRRKLGPTFKRHPLNLYTR